MNTYSFILVAIVYYLNCNRTSVPAYQEVLVKFAVSVALQAVLFEASGRVKRMQRSERKI